MEKLEHIGIAVKNMDAANKLFASLLGRTHYKIEEVPSEGVRTSFFDIGGVKIELLEATREDSPIAKFIEKKGEGIHHLAFEVKNIMYGAPFRLWPPIESYMSFLFPYNSERNSASFLKHRFYLNLFRYGIEMPGYVLD